MPSYVITGANRGLGYAFLQNISSNPENTVIGIVRNVAETEAKISSWKTPNIHLVAGDLHNYESLKKAAEATSIITSGSLDYLIANAGLIPKWSFYDPLSVLGQDPERLTQELNTVFTTNVIGQIHLVNVFMPLILKGAVKKVVTISSGVADADVAVKYNLYESAPYSISKAAVNMAVAKFHAEYEKDGVLFLAICPGPADTGLYDDNTEEENKKLLVRDMKFLAYAPESKGHATPEDAVRDVLKVAEGASLANGDGGAFLSHLGNKQWI
ncbi:hypothetical protein DE146DRAFT_788343 [Phaeosphaeria sp. MPI-PUGE-AT-0046c]|nr:hypothetical protein DE146DRAFT_788343 [Phaeosphaeria sp. MPI-PUGE-AT-0046c]